MLGNLSLLEFDWDTGNWPKCAKHGLSREEIEFVLSNRLLVRRDPSSAMEPRFNAVGLTGEVVMPSSFSRSDLASKTC